MNSPPPRRLLLVGGGGGLVGRAVLERFTPEFQIRSVHRHPVPRESALGVEWIPADVAEVSDWTRLLTGIDTVLVLAWYRAGPARRFERLGAGLERLVQTAQAARVGRLLHVSVPPAPADLEDKLPYLVFKRRVDRAIRTSGLSYSIICPSALFGPRDKLLGVMLRLIHRYHLFPMFGDGEYHLSPLSVDDLAALLRRLADSDVTGQQSGGGPIRYRYRDLTDLMFRLLGLTPHYWRMSTVSGRRLARLMESFGSSLLYAYEVEWLASDLLGLPPIEADPSRLRSAEVYLRQEAWRMSGHRHSASTASG